MTLSPLASIDDLAVWLGQPAETLDSARAGMVLDVVSGIVRTEAGVTWEGLPVPDQVRGVTAQVAARTYRNPTNAQQQTTGPFMVQGADLGGIVLTAAEKAIIHAAVGTSRGLWSQPLTRNDPADATVYVPTVGGPDFPWYGPDVPR